MYHEYEMMLSRLPVASVSICKKNKNFIVLGLIDTVQKAIRVTWCERALSRLRKDICPAA